MRLRLAKVVFLLGAFLLGCTSHSVGGSEGPLLPSSLCNIYSVEINGEPTGTAFNVSDQGVGYRLTAAHVVRSVKPQIITLRTICSDDRIVVDSVSALPGHDLALLFTSNATIGTGLPLRDTNVEWGEPICSPNFSSIHKSSSRFKNKLIPSCGRVVGNDENFLLVTLNVITTGGSGAPIFDARGRVVGVLTNRINTEGAYAGVAYGVDSKTIQDALRYYSRPGN